MESPLQQLKGLIRALPQGLQDHLERVQETALTLATAHGADREAVELAALGHDLARAYSAEALLTRAQEWSLGHHPVEEQSPILLHGPVAAEVLRRQCGVEDVRVLEAVRWHSTAVPGMGPVGLVVFLADKLEPGKRSRYPWQDEVRSLVGAGLDRAALCFVENQVQYLRAKEFTVHPHTLRYREALILRTG